MNPSRTPTIANSAPFEAHLTDYDRAHTATYLRLLDAAKDGAHWEEASQIVLGIDPLREPARAKRAYDSHIARARWLTEHGYKEFLERDP